MKRALLIATTLVAFAIGATASAAPFGSKEDVSDANKLWKSLVKGRLIGKNMINSTPYTGQHPHGAILETVDTIITSGGHTGAVIVKRNYGGKGVSKEAVANDPHKWLKAVTVMFKREKGYDTEDKDWFFVKYNAKGDVLSTPAGVKLAGRVGKGKACIGCHKAAPGGDFVYNNDRF